MTFDDIKDVLTFSAFRPEPDDRQAPWSRRFSEKNTLLLNIGRGQTSWKAVGKGGKLLDGGIQHGDFKEIASRLSAEWRALTDDGWCAVSLNTRYAISLETNVSRKPGVEELIRTNPRVVLGARYERGKRYVFVNNPESLGTVLLTVDEEQIKLLETQLKEIGLKAGRICCGSYAMLRRLLETVHTGADKDAAKDNSLAQQATFLNVICCEGAVCAMLENGDVWTDLRSRSDLYKEGDYEGIFEILKPLIARLSGAGGIRFASDGVDTVCLQELRKRYPDISLTEYSGPDHLWRLMADL